MQRGTDGIDSAASERTRAKILEAAWEGLGLGGVAERGFSLRVALVGLHEFESKSKAAAASGEGLAFAGKLEKASSEDVAANLGVLAGEASCSLCLLRGRGGGGGRKATRTSRKYMPCFGADVDRRYALSLRPSP